MDPVKAKENAWTESLQSESESQNRESTLGSEYTESEATEILKQKYGLVLNTTDENTVNKSYNQIHADILQALDLF